MNTVVRLEDSHPELADFIQKIALNKSTKYHILGNVKINLNFWKINLCGIRIISNGNFLGINNRIIAISYPKTGRNAPCFCGSGKKYKKCCGR